MEAEMVARVRRFHRTVTQRMGALHDEYLARGRSLGQARLLWEIGPDGCEVRTLRSRLDLDSGYLSRLLRALEVAGLVTVDADGLDRRVRTARLTAAGLAERTELDRRSDQLASSILEPLNNWQREMLIRAMVAVEELLVASMIQIEEADPRHPDARHCFQAYFAELAERFDEGFDPDRSISAADHELTAPEGMLLVARLHGDPVGCGALKFHADAPAEIKRMWVHPGARGLGLGVRLLAELESRAIDRGVRVLRLETNRNLIEAIQLYRSAGYQQVPAFNDEPYADYWLEKTLPSSLPPDSPTE
jgi:GNAT superfamily N-acetyltransferase/DNA-binding MarR family transcriptional regulator